MNIVMDSKRGCGSRKPGGYYIMSDMQHAYPCGRLPIITGKVCDTSHTVTALGSDSPTDTTVVCSNVIPTIIVDDKPLKPSRSHRMIYNPTPLWNRKSCEKGWKCDPLCPASGSPYAENAIKKLLVIWVGKNHYETPKIFMDEADKLGISRNVRGVPKDFNIDDTWLALGHRNGKKIDDIRNVEKLGDEDNPEYDPDFPEYLPSIFSIVKPTAIEYVIKGDETEEFLNELKEKGITPVDVVNSYEELIGKLSHDAIEELMRIADNTHYWHASEIESGKIAPFRQELEDAYLADIVLYPGSPEDNEILITPLGEKLVESEAMEEYWKNYVENQTKTEK